MPSADHDATSSTGELLVTHYNLEIYAVGANTPFQVSSLGKPSPGPDGRITIPLLLTAAPDPATAYQARVATVGPTGTSPSDWSNTFTFGATGSSSAVAAFANGGFEADYTGWLASGNQQVVANGAYGSSVSEGARAVSFNAGQQPASAVLSQTFATNPGQTYTLSFDIGAFSFVNFDTQSLHVTVKGTTTLLSQTVSIDAHGDGTHYATQTMKFVADNAWTTLTFQDVSATTEDVDLFLDNVGVVNSTSAMPIASDALDRRDWMAWATEAAPGDPPANALDGNIDTRFSTGSAQFDSQGFIVSWPGDRTIGRIRMQIGLSTNDYPRTCGIWVKDSVGSVTFVNCTADADGNVDVSFAPIPASTIEVWQWGASPWWWSIAEFNVFQR